MQAWLTGLVFALSTSVIENVYTLSKAENFQVLLMVSAILLVVMAPKSANGVRFWLLLGCTTLLILVACFTKESTLIMLPISLVWWVIARLGQMKHVRLAPFVEKVTALDLAVQPGEWPDLLSWSHHYVVIQNSRGRVIL